MKTHDGHDLPVTIDMLTDLPLFGRLQKEDALELWRHASVRTVPRMGWVEIQGIPARVLTVLVSGSCQTQVGDQLAPDLMPGAILGLEALEESRPSPATFVTREPSDILVIPFDVVRQVLSGRSDLSSELDSPALEPRVPYTATVANGWSAEHDLPLLTKALCGQRFESGLDLGTGAGDMALTLENFCERMMASEITEQRRFACQKWLDLRGGETHFTSIVADATNIPLKENCLDLLSSRLSAHHFPSRTDFLTEASRVLKPGGLLAITDLSCSNAAEGLLIDEWETSSDTSHCRVYSPKSWTQMLSNHGFEPILTRKVVREIELYSRNQGRQPRIRLADLRRILKKAKGRQFRWMFPNRASARETHWWSPRVVLLAQRRSH